MSRNERSRSTVLIVLLLANIAFLAYIVVRTRENRRATTDLEASMTDLHREIDLRDREINERLRERTQARLERDDARGEAERLKAEAAGLASTLEDVRTALAGVRAQRDEHLGARLAAERRVEDALSALTGLEPLKAKVRELEAGLREKDSAGAALRAERAEWEKVREALTERLHSLTAENEALSASRATLRQRLLDLSRLALSRSQGE